MRPPGISLLILLLGAGCSGVRTTGLAPLEPHVERPTFSLECRFVTVDSLRPLFRWEPFHPADDAGVEEVTYELRIWTLAVDGGSRLAYGRMGIREPRHVIETPLEPDTPYIWSVRAHLIVDGRLRFTEWTLAGLPLRGEAVPNSSCLRIRTPHQ